jgi:hypothetical protein
MATPGDIFPPPGLLGRRAVGVRLVTFMTLSASAGLVLLSNEKNRKSISAAFEPVDIATPVRQSLNALDAGTGRPDWNLDYIHKDTSGHSGLFGTRCFTDAADGVTRRERFLALGGDLGFNYLLLIGNERDLRASANAARVDLPALNEADRRIIAGIKPDIGAPDGFRGDGALDKGVSWVRGKAIAEPGCYDLRRMLSAGDYVDTTFCSQRGGWLVHERGGAISIQLNEDGVATPNPLIPKEINIARDAAPIVTGTLPLLAYARRLQNTVTAQLPAPRAG